MRKNIRLQVNKLERLPWRIFPKTNTLAYLVSSLATKKKKFYNIVNRTAPRRRTSWMERRCFCCWKWFRIGPKRCGQIDRQ